MRRILLALVLCWGAAGAGAAEPVQVMVLGTYHFGNPGLDLNNVKVDDVLQPARQAQVREVVDALAAFKPTRVAVEAQADALPQHALPSYRAYLAGQGQDKRNEIDQIGFRLARQLGHAEVYGVDVDGDFPFEPVQAFAKTSGNAAEFQRSMDAMALRTREFEAAQQHATVGQLLRRLNEPDSIRDDHGWYMTALRQGRGADQPGVALVGSWYARNLGICARLAQLARPGDRLLVLYGAGHSYLLRHCVDATPGWQLVEANAYLPR
ncbi:DUF5694 domain-containing protein [Ideonella sp.]|uniref:DUF5694 domain-containing protein n=1 Tax=Ideonella sp. TaxID=1929293 RepID=UPI0035AFDDF0